MSKDGPPPAGKKTKKEKMRERKLEASGENSGSAAPAKVARSGAAAAPGWVARSGAAAAPGCRVFVGHCPGTLTEERLRAAFAKCGALSEVDMMRRPNGRFKGTAFVTFATSEAAAAALGLNGSDLDGKNIVVEMGSSTPKSNDAQRPADPAASPAGGDAASASASVFVDNLAASADKAAVRSALREFGSIKGVKLLPRGTGQQAAFVDFSTAEEAAKAVAATGFARPPPSSGVAVRISFSRRDPAEGALTLTPGASGSGGGSGGGSGSASSSSKGRSQAAKIRRREKRDKARGIVREPKGEGGGDTGGGGGGSGFKPNARPKPAGSEFAPPQFAPPKSAIQKPRSGGGGAHKGKPAR